jgi:hypothetical protein
LSCLLCAAVFFTLADFRVFSPTLRPVPLDPVNFKPTAGSVALADAEARTVAAGGTWRGLKSQVHPPTRGFEGRSVLHDQMKENPFLSFLAEGPAETLRREREATAPLTRSRQITVRPPVDASAALAAAAAAADAAAFAGAPPAGIPATDPAPVTRYIPSSTFAAIDAIPAAGDSLPKQREMPVAPQMLTTEQRAQIQARNALERKEQRETKRQLGGSRQAGIGTFGRRSSGVPPTQAPPVLMPTQLPGRAATVGTSSRFVRHFFLGFTFFLVSIFL